MNNAPGRTLQQKFSTTFGKPKREREFKIILGKVEQIKKLGGIGKLYNSK